MAETNAEPTPPEATPEEEAEKKAKKEKRRINRNIKSMYRTASRNHVAYVAIGDRRANILIGTCTLIISVTFTIFLRGSTEPSLYLIPGIILIITCTATMILAMISTRPYNARGFYTMEEILTQPVNLLF